jgi:hypothetical protein
MPWIVPNAEGVAVRVGLGPAVAVALGVAVRVGGALVGVAVAAGGWYSTISLG